MYTILEFIPRPAWWTQFFHIRELHQVSSSSSSPSLSLFSTSPCGHLPTSERCQAFSWSTLLQTLPSPLPQGIFSFHHYPDTFTLTKIEKAAFFGRGASSLDFNNGFVPKTPERLCKGIREAGSIESSLDTVKYKMAFPFSSCPPNIISDEP